MTSRRNSTISTIAEVNSCEESFPKNHDSPGCENYAFEDSESLSSFVLNFQDFNLNDIHNYVNEATAKRRASTAVVEDDVVCNIATFLGETLDHEPVKISESKQDILSLELSELEKVSDVTDKACATPEEPPESNLRFIQWKLRQFIQSFGFRLTALIIIMADICVVITDNIVTFNAWFNNVHKDNAIHFDILDATLSLIFILELGIRIAALGIKPFFKVWQNALDTVLVIASFVLSIVDLVMDEDVSTALKFLIVFRVVRIVRIVRLYTEKKRLEKAARYLVSQNKRRFQHDGFDLDLTYVTDRVIAMSFPSSGQMSLYRNPIKEVSRFFETKHGGHYKVYNLCSERSYDPSYFQNRVERYLLDDHNVPMLSEMISFCQSARNWLESHPRNIVAVHCKGGKGRTGTMICIWLVEAGLFPRAADSLDYFGARRTDLRTGRRFQGVETPSQSRYVGYYERIKMNQGMIRSDQPLRLVRLRLSGLKGVGQGDGKDFRFTLNLGRDPPCFFVDFSNNLNCQTFYVVENDTLEVVILSCPILNGDTRLVFHCNSKWVPKGCENAAFYLWFHTAMVSHCYLTFKREELDNPHKAKTWRVFSSKFGLELFFQEAVSDIPESSYL